MVLAPSSDPPSFVVVVVEDETLIRMLAVEALTEAGFVVLQAGNAADAMAILKSQGIGIHVLFTDIHMPGLMDGLDLAYHSHSHWPWIAVLVASGKARPRSAEMPVGTRFLSKPYNLGHMMNEVRELAVIH
jgi:DNA-binding NtrC family response regulator